MAASFPRDRQRRYTELPIRIEWGASHPTTLVGGRRLANQRGASEA